MSSDERAVDPGATHPAPHRFSSSTDPDVSLHRLEWGAADAPPLVLLHGGGANAHWWDHIAPAFAARHRVIALDFRGHGDSTFPETLRVGAFNDDLESLVQDIGREDVVLVGHSMGGHVALDHAARHASVRALVAIDIARGGSKRSRRAARLALALRRTYRSREEAIERYRFLPDAPWADDTLRRTIAGASVAPDPDGRWGYKFDARWFGLPPRERPALSQVRCPTLIVRGAESPLLSAEGAEAFASELPDARVREVADAGHHVQIDQPEAVQAAIQAFLDELEGA